MIVRELLTKLGFDADNSSVDRYEQRMTKLRGTLTAVVAAGTAVAGAAALVTTQAAQAAAEISRLSRLSNATTDQFQRMSAGAEAYGVQSDKLSDILKDTNDRVGDFLTTGGGPMADFFENVAPKVGVTADMFRGLSGPDALQLYVSSLEKANLEQAQMVFYMEAMASDSTLLLPLLAGNGAEMERLADQAERFGSIMSEETIHAGRELTMALGGVRMAVRGLQLSIAEQMMPELTSAVRGMLGWYEANAEFIRQNLQDAIARVTGAISMFVDAIGGVLSLGQDFVDIMGGWEVAAWPLGAAVLMLARRVGMLSSVMRGLLIVAALDDLRAWYEGQESLIGKILGPYEDFAEAVGKARDALAGFFETLGMSGEKAEKLANLTLALGGMVALAGGLRAFNLALSGLGIALSALGTGAVATGVGVLSKIAGLAGLLSLAPAAAVLGASTKQTGDGTLPEGAPIPTGTYEENFGAGPAPLLTDPGSPSASFPGEFSAGAAGGSRSVVINDNRRIEVTPPPGTNQEVVDNMVREFERLMNEQVDNAASSLEAQ